jgi:hypothetical protein
VRIKAVAKRTGAKKDLFRMIFDVEQQCGKIKGRIQIFSENAQEHHFLYEKKLQS